MKAAVKVKKAVGRLGRRYGGRPFQTVRKLCYDSLRLMPEIRAVFGLWRKDFTDKGSEDALFYDRYLGKPAERRPGLSACTTASSYTAD